MLSMIAVAAKSGLVLTTWVSSKSSDFAFASRDPRRSPKSDVSMAAPVANETVQDLIRSREPRRVEELRFVTADTRQRRSEERRVGKELLTGLWACTVNKYR